MGKTTRTTLNILLWEIDMKPFFKLTLTSTRRSIYVGGLALFLFSCATEKPINLSIAREEVQQYYESGKFDEELNAVIAEAKEKFSKVDFKNNSVVIFDVDETVLNNYELAEQMGFGYVYEMNKKWNAEMKAPAIPQVKDLYDFLLSKGAKIIFLTGRNIPEYEVTFNNLKQADYSTFDTLITQRKHAVSYTHLRAHET